MGFGDIAFLVFAVWLGLVVLGVIAFLFTRGFLWGVIFGMVLAWILWCRH